MTTLPLRVLSALAASLFSALLVAGETVPSPAAAFQSIVVLTSYPEELTTRYQQAFEQAHPQYALQIVWAHSADAMARLQQRDGGGVDIYWTPSPAAFASLAEHGDLAKLAVDRQQLPGKIGEQLISDPQDRYQAFEVAGYGLAVNPAGLQRRGLPIPQQWAKLAAPEYAGLVLWPDPLHAGFAPALYDIILQSQGWQAGWAMLSEAVTQGQLTSRPAQLVEQVASDQVPIGLSVDFMVRSAQANGRAIVMSYPARTAFLPAQIGVLANAPHAAAARVFANFVLSAPGQALLFEPDIARYPVRPSVYAQAPAGTFNPFSRPSDAGFNYDATLEQARSGLIVALFETALAERAETLKSLWRALHVAEASQHAHPDPALAKRLAQIRSLLGAVPLSEGQAADPGLQKLFQRADDSMQAQDSQNSARSAVLAQWRASLDHNEEQARQLLATLPAR